MNNTETRHLVTQIDEVRADDKLQVITGYVAKFDERSQFMGFYEQIDKRAFDNSLESGKNIFALYNHDYDKILGSTRNGTLELFVDEVGLRFNLTPKANTSYLRDILELVENREIQGMSFGFRVKKDEWQSADGHDIRTLLDVDLAEVTLTAIPAYEQSEVALRSHQEYRNELDAHKKRELDKMKIKLELMQMDQL